MIKAMREMIDEATRMAKSKPALQARGSGGLVSQGN
jgi:hypothetical protein